MQTRLVAAILTCLIGFATVSAQQRAADGVIVNDAGEPQYSTFSLCAIDPATGQSGAAVTTRVPFVGRAVPHVRAGVGAVCTQASTAPPGLVDARMIDSLRAAYFEKKRNASTK